ncbi:MAG: ABC transporter permease [Rhodobacteraceae bacterium]|nr:ABC transporter permease [Paracoccaceae bacterium]
MTGSSNVLALGRGFVPTPSRLRALAWRAVSIILTLIGLLALTFFIGRLLPADPVLAITGFEVDRETYEKVYRELGLDRPVWQQFLSYMGGVLQGDLGESTTTGQPVVKDLARAFPATLELALAAAIVGSVIGIPLGIAAAVNRGGWIDHVARVIGLAGYSIPIFWMGLMALFIFYAKLNWVGASGRMDVYYEGLVPPVTGLLIVDSILARDWTVLRSALAHIVLPASVLGYYSTAYISRMTRSFMLEQLSQEYIIAARAKGLSRNAVIWRHAFKNIRVQLLTVIALVFGGLLDGTVLIETVFGWPGVGQYLTRGLQFNDINIVMSTVLMIGVLFLAVNTASDWLYRRLDPRTR